MERQDYQILTNRYEHMRNRFANGKQIGWIMLLMQAVAVSGCLVVASDSKSELFTISCRIYCLIVMGAVLVTNIKLIFMNKFNFTGVDMAAYCLVNVFAIMGSIEMLLIGIIAYDTAEIALLFLAIDIIVCIGFWIAVERQNKKRLKSGGYQLKKHEREYCGKIWIWGVTALPFIPLMTLAGRRIWLVSSDGIIRTLLVMYMLLWLWLVLIYSLFVPSLLFIRLEKKMERKDEDKEKIIGNE